ncbi:MAG: laminin G domain-containing protein, partial [Saprospiraceae bacterium]|nr:laminin G domain-containing protein [Saprospiraceae bacterium]
MNSVLTNFTKTYSNKTYRYTSMVRHKGAVIAFASDAARRIYYAVLDNNPTAPNGSDAPSPLDANNWPAKPEELIFPNEISRTGFGVADQTLLPLFPKEGRVPVKPGTLLDKRDSDLFLSGTARFTSDAPFQVLSDGEYIYLFRQAIGSGDPDMVWTDNKGHLITSRGGSKDFEIKRNMSWVDEEGQHPVYKEDLSGNLTLTHPEYGEPVPVLDGTLLLDRFVLVGSELQSRLEVRFQRSRSKTRPQSRKDSLGAKDLNGRDFFEPTQELHFVGNLTGGRFTVLLLPTSVAGVERWQIFTQNKQTNRIDSFNAERSADGLFNTRGTQGLDTRIYAESALQLEKTGNKTDFVTLSKGVVFDGPYTQEAWIFPSKTQNVAPQAVFTGDNTDATGAPSMWIEAQTRLRVGFGDGQKFQAFLSKSILKPETWNHVAVAFDGSAFRFYVDGKLRDKVEVPGGIKPGANPVKFFGREENGFTGIVDEIRFWNRARGEKEFQDDMNQRLTGLEPGLSGYWRFDEGEGNIAFDHTDNNADGTLSGGKKWVRSEAPVGENSGINRNSFQIITRDNSGNAEERTIESGLSALLYFQQSNVASGYEGQQKPLKQSARVMLSVATKGKAAGDKPFLAALDFGVSASGRLAQIPARVALETIQTGGTGTKTVNQQLDEFSAAENAVRTLNDAVFKLAAEAQKRQAELTELENAVNSAKVTVFKGADFTGEFLVFNFKDAKDGVPQVLREVVVPFKTLNAANFNDQIKSIRISEPLQVVIFENDVSKPARSILLTENTPDTAAVIAGQSPAWSTSISGLHITVNTAYKTKIDTAGKRLAQANIELSERQQLLSDARAKLASLQSVLRSGAELAMPLVNIDAFGYSVSGALLGFAWTNDTPLLFDSATGTLSLYFRGGDNQFFVAYFSTFTEKAKYSLKDVLKNTTVIASARSADLDMDKIVVEISGDESNPTCTLSIEGAGIKETWSKMPRDPEMFSRVLNGKAGHYTDKNTMVGYREFIGLATIKKVGNQLTLNASNGINRALQAGADLIAGKIRVVLSEAAAAGNQPVLLNISSDATDFPSEELPVYFMEYDYAVLAKTTKVPGDLFGGSLLLFAVPVPGQSGMIGNQRVSSGATLSSKWTAGAPGSTLAFNGADTFVQAPAPADFEKFDLKDDLTLEAWIRPGNVSARSRLIQHKSDRSNYALGLLPKEVKTAFQFDGADDYVTFRNSAHLSFAGSVTVEAWIKPEAIDGIRNIVAQGYPFSGDLPEFFLRIENNQYQFGHFSDGNFLAKFPIPEADGKGKDWIHLAGVYDAGAKHWILYRNGIPGLPTGSENGKPLQTTDWGIGANPDPNGTTANKRLFKGAIDDVRIWKRARTQEEILADMNHRLAGNETGLAAYWLFETGFARDHAGNNPDGVLHGTPAQAVSPLPAYSVFAGVNGKFVQTTGAFAAGIWAHFAAAYTRAYGLQFNGQNAYLDGGKDDTLNINTDLTLEIWLTKQWFGNETLIARGKFGAVANQHPPYSLSVDSSANLVFSFEDTDGKRHSFRTTGFLTVGQPCRVAASRKRRTLSGTNNNITTLFAWDEITLSIDGATETFRYTSSDAVDKAIADGLAGTFPSTFGSYPPPPDIGRSDAPVEIGRNFIGIITEVRIWNKGRDAAARNNPQDPQDGLVSWWRLDEREGTKAFDSKGQNHATLQGSILWVPDPDATRSGLTLYRNGSDPLPTENLSAAGVPATQNQFTLGALAGAGTQEFFRGELEEVRIWNTWRTPEQVQDNMFRRLNGELDDLIAYYTFDIEKDSMLLDNALRGNDLKVQGTGNYMISTAPISDDTPQVRSALAGVRTPFSGLIDSKPAVQEYGDLQLDGKGNLIGVFKRCYGVVNNGSLQLITGFKVGDLATEWIGQVQYAPQLVGFIEGAPPVPAENLTQPSVEMIGDLDDYNEASTVEFQEAEETTYSYASSKEKGSGFEIEYGLKLGFLSKTDVGPSVVVASLSSIEESKVLFGARARFEAMWSWTEESTIGTTRTKGQNTSLELRGRYTAAEQIDDQPLIRKFIPDNVGLALVKSRTADVFALRLKHNNALISFSMRPNPDIPEDWNILHFPINPRYTKQGTLDGKIGKDADINYPGALEYSTDSSYFKPKEAYALRDRIQKEETGLMTYYEQFNA